jgi:hypothetical protein
MSKSHAGKNSAGFFSAVRETTGKKRLKGDVLQETDRGRQHKAETDFAL